MDEHNPAVPEQTAPPAAPYPPYTYTPTPRHVFPMGKRELLFAAAILFFSLIACNCLIYAGVNLGFAVGIIGILTGTWLYLRSCGHKTDRYTTALLVLSLLIAAAFARSANSGIKFCMVCILLAVPSLAFCLMAGQNLRPTGGISSLLDGPRALFSLGFGRMAASGRGVADACKSSGTIGKKGGSVILGLLITVPVIAILIPLLMSADAAFEGLMDRLPKMDWDELFCTALLGFCTACVFYTRGTALHHLPKAEREPRTRKGLNSITVNTVLVAVVFVYGVYLISQLAYFVGGFAGILPEEYTLAQYARRGFFEMAWLCAINLTLMALSMGLVSARGKAPLATRLLCLGLGAVTLFLVCAASAKMFLYIGSYGLTRLRVLTEVFMLWLAAVTVCVCVWLFRPRTPYLKFALVLGLALCAVLMWADVDTQVARYNVQAYQSGKLETVDMVYLRDLGYSAVPYLEELTQDPDPDTAQRAANLLRNFYTFDHDIRSWNYAKAKALPILEQYRDTVAAESAEVLTP